MIAPALNDEIYSPHREAYDRWHDAFSTDPGANAPWYRLVKSHLQFQNLKRSRILEIGCGALVLPEQIIVGRADDAFDDMDNLKDEDLTTTLKEMVRRLIDLASVMPKAVE